MFGFSTKKYDKQEAIKMNGRLLSRLSIIFGVSADDLIKVDLEKEYYNIKKYNKKEVKEKITQIVSNSELEENKKQMIINVIEVACEE